MGKPRHTLHKRSPAGVDWALLVAAGVCGGVVLATLIIGSGGFAIKREIDVVELAQVTVVAAAALILQRRYDKCKRLQQAESEQIATVIAGALSAASECHRQFRTAQISPQGAVESAARQGLVQIFAQLDAEIIAIERLVNDCGLSSPDDEFIGRNERFNDIVMKEGLNTPSLSGASADIAFTDLRLALARTRRRVLLRL